VANSDVMIGYDGGSSGGDGDTAVMPADLRAEFARRGQTMTVRKGQIVIAEGSDADDVYLILSGQFRISLSSHGGREVILRDVGPDQIMGELSAIDGQLRSTSAVAASDARLARLSGDGFTAFLGEVPQAGLWMARQLAGRVRDLTSRSFDLVTLPVGSRVHRELLRLAEEQGAASGADRWTVTPMPTHAEIAARIGTHREAVSREFGLLVKEGIVKKAGRGLEILSMAALQALQERMRR
jgi:CRP/FNR family transcriptional regulator, cyclic AMP receptor protein